MKTLILGMGNTILSDDGVGIYIARKLQKQIQRKDVEIKETCLAGLNLLDLLAGYDRAILIDAIKTKEGNWGDIYRFRLDYLMPTARLATFHEVNFATAMVLGRKLGTKLPEDIIIFAVEVKDDQTFSEKCTQEVEKAIPKVVEMILQEL